MMTHETHFEINHTIQDVRETEIPYEEKCFYDDLRMEQREQM